MVCLRGLECLGVKSFSSLELQQLEELRRALFLSHFSPFQVADIPNWKRAGSKRSSRWGISMLRLHRSHSVHFLALYSIRYIDPSVFLLSSINYVTLLL